jgi:protein-S-isoprenylcysteine O-methyltransferase Ste14
VLIAVSIVVGLALGFGYYVAAARFTLWMIRRRGQAYPGYATLALTVVFVLVALVFDRWTPLNALIVAACFALGFIVLARVWPQAGVAVKGSMGVSRKDARDKAQGGGTGGGS